MTCARFGRRGQIIVKKTYSERRVVTARSSTGECVKGVGCQGVARATDQQA